MSQKLIGATGPFTRVVDVLDSPYIDTTQVLKDASNGYFRSQSDQSSWVARPGFTLKNPAAQMGSGTVTQGAYTYIDPSSNTSYRFFVVNGVLYRSDSAFATFTNVTPIAVTIDAAATRVSFTSVGNALVVSDGVNRPWVMSNYASTPVTGTYIDIDGAGGSWSAWGVPTVYEDSVFFIVLTAPGGSAVQSRVGIVWCEPNQPTVGYLQTGYADFWNLVENGSDPIMAILGTNSGLFYWRPYSIGVLAGTPSLSFSTTATRDARGTSVGTFSPWAIALYNNTIFFIDARARPWSMAVDSSPVPIWKQMYAKTQFAPASIYDPANLSVRAVGAIVPELNLYFVAPFGAPSLDFANIGIVFDADTGAYCGTWSIGQGVNLDVIGVMRDTNNTNVTCVCGGNAADTSGGYVWTQNFLNDSAWTDTGGFFNAPSVTTQPIGYSADQEIHPDRAIIISMSGEALTVVANTSYSMSVPGVSVSDIVSPGSGTTFTHRYVMGMDGSATRFLRFTVTAPTSPTQQFGVQRIEVYGTRELAVLDP